MTNAEAVERCIARLGLEASDAHTDADLEPLVDEALKAYMKGVATAESDSPEERRTLDGRRQLIFQDYTVALTSGTGSLTTAFASAPQLIAGADKHWRVLVAGETLLSSWLPDRQSIGMGRNRLVSYFCCDGPTLRTRDRTGSLTGFTSVNATVSGPAVLAIGSLPVQLQDEYLDVLTELVKGRLQGGTQ